MTPSEYIEATAEDVHKSVGKATGIFVIMLVRHRMNLDNLHSVRWWLADALEKLDQLIAYCTRIKEGQKRGPSQNSAS